MIHMTTCEVHDLEHCQSVLERVLATLDATGAGIAAIHVDAAIEQIKRNILLAKSNGVDLEGTSFFIPEENG